MPDIPDETVIEQAPALPDLSEIGKALANFAEPETCGTCDYFANKIGICRRWGPTPAMLQRAPQVMGGQASLEQISLWPPADPRGWCGEWAAVDHNRKRGGGANTYGSERTKQ